MWYVAVIIVVFIFELAVLVRWSYKGIRVEVGEVGIAALFALAWPFVLLLSVPYFGTLGLAKLINYTGIWLRGRINDI
jgi:K+-transporting ATPase A subunit